MGGGQTKVESNKKAMTDTEWELDVLGYSSSDLSKLRKIFKKASTGENIDEGEIGRILFIFGLEGNRFMRHLFSMIECSENCVNFRDMVVILFFFCTNTDDISLGMFVFEMFDTNHNGLLDYQEFDYMMTTVFGSKRPMGGVMKLLQNEILQQRESDDDEGGVTQTFFADFCKNNPLLLREVEILQKHARMASKMGQDSWKRCRMQRKMLLGDEGEEGAEVISNCVSWRRFNRNLQRGLYTHSPDAVEDLDSIKGYRQEKVDPARDGGEAEASRDSGVWKSAAMQQGPMSMSQFSPGYTRRSKSRQNSYNSVTDIPEEKESVKSNLKKAQRKSLSRQASSSSLGTTSRQNSSTSIVNGAEWE